MSSRNVQIDAASLGTVNRAFGVVGLLVGLALLFGGAYFVHHAHLDEFLGLIAKSQTAEGTVIENRPVEVHPSSGRTLPYTSYQAIVAFADQNDRPVTLPDQIAFSPPSFRVGQRVRVFYDPQNPQRAMRSTAAEKISSSPESASSSVAPCRPRQYSAPHPALAS